MAKASAARTTGRGGSKRRSPADKSKAARRGTPPRRRLRLGWLVKWSLVVGIWGSVAVGVVLAYYAYTLPEIGHLETPTRSPGTTVTTADGTVLASYGDLHAGYVDVNDLPSVVPDAVLAIEDRRFYEHFGVDPIGLARAAAVNLLEGEIVQGGSTITQQLAKNLFLSPERTLSRKIQELLLAFWLEHRFSKDQILTLYLNRVYLGAGTYGVEAASQRYFGKSARRLSLAEAAMLAGLLKAPSRYAPTRDLARARDRADQVLAAMVEADMITAEVAQAARERPATPGASAAGNGLYYFADWVVEQVPSYVGGDRTDMTVDATLDPALQRAAASALLEVLDDAGARMGATQGAIIAMTPDGAVKAMVGGRSYARSQFNRATQARRQPGSAFKLFVYIAAFEAGLSADDRIVDRPVAVDGWRPDNYRSEYHGEISLTEAFALSSNSAAVQLAERVGPARVAAVARRLGVVSPLMETPSLALGTSEITLLELTAAYGAVASGGRGVWPYGITAIRDRDGEVLYSRGGSGPEAVLDPAIARTMEALLRAAVETGTGRAVAPIPGAAGKTGTSQDFRDAWFVGFTPDLVAGVWVGNDDSSPMQGVTGGTLPAQIWRRFMDAAR